MAASPPATPAKKPHDLRIVANELHAFSVVAHCVAHTPERRAGEPVHQEHAQEAPGSDQIIDLDLLAEAHAEQSRQPGPIGCHPFLAAEEAAQDENAGADKLGKA